MRGAGDRAARASLRERAGRGSPNRAGVCLCNRPAWELEDSREELARLTVAQGALAPVARLPSHSFPPAPRLARQAGGQAPVRILRFPLDRSGSNSYRRV